MIDTSEIKDEYEKAAREQSEYIKKIFIESKSDFLELRTDKPFLNEVIKFFNARQKRGKW